MDRVEGNNCSRGGSYIVVSNIVVELLVLHFNNTVHNLPQKVTIVGYCNDCPTVLPQSFLFSTKHIH